MLEHIHPFRDGNGRIGRLWQTLILSRWNPLFAWTPVETLVHYNQALYYKALQDSQRGVQPDCEPFIDYMLDMIENALLKFMDTASETKSIQAGEGRNVPVNVPVNQRRILAALKARPSATIGELAEQLGVADKTIKRGLKALKAAGRIVRIGSDKAGHWEVRANEF